ncbi:MAG: SDR family NAD(P)-dependent oxidoreductase [Pseudomonadota bacterium]|nr:SDR family NAD(P)-dependent oxidoreductase [Pseudomonadota bacterium]
MHRLSDRTIYITGASSGLGLATARLAAQAGAHVALLVFDQPEASLQAVEAARARPEQQVAVRVLDVRDAAAVGATIDELARHWRRPDALLHCAGLPGGLPFEQLGAAEFDRVIQVNLYGTRHVAAAALPWLEQTRGRLLLVASLGGLVGCYGYTSYGASKFGVVGLAEALRYEYQPRGVSVGIFCPPEFPSGLVELEKSQTHPASKLLKKMGGSISQAQAARAALAGLASRRFRIVPGLMAKLLLLQLRLLPTALVHAVGDMQVRQVLRRHGR